VPFAFSATAGATDAASIKAATTIKIAMLHHLSLMLLLVFIMLCPLSLQSEYARPLCPRTMSAPASLLRTCLRGRRACSVFC
jgi:hypothetical protein